MLHFEDSSVRDLLLKGNFGLEKESLRITPDGRLAQTPHPFSSTDSHVVRDFCENQTEINTEVTDSPEAAVDALARYTTYIHRQLEEAGTGELLWPFSNPPYIRNEADIPVAQFYGALAEKTAYRHYLSDRYGRYKMTLSGIHVNYSFSDELLQADFALSGERDFQAYKSRLYLELAEHAAACGWIVTALTAASPLVDSSYVEKGNVGADTFLGMASVRCSELGYWNYFTPIFNYSNLNAYADSIQSYVDDGLLSFPSELYYPIRLKPPGTNTLDALRQKGISHIELRMVDLNPLTYAGIDLRDLKFIQLLLVWLAAAPRHPYPNWAQVQAVQNFKNAAHYDLKTVKIMLPDGVVCSVADAGLRMISRMRAFYKDFPTEVTQILDFEEDKFLVPEHRYAWILRREMAEEFVPKGLVTARQHHEEALRRANAAG